MERQLDVGKTQAITEVDIGIGVVRGRELWVVTSASQSLIRA